jgi:hypothetical protein
MVVAISAHDVPSLLGLNPYVPQKLAMAKVLLQQRHPILEALRGDRLVRRILGDVYPYSYDVDAAIRGRGGASVLQCGGFVIYGYPKVTGTSIVMTKERRTWRPIAPAYDLASLQAHMRLAGVSTGWLLETKDKDIRESLACRADFDWEAAVATMGRIVEELKAADGCKIMYWLEAGRRRR